MIAIVGPTASGKTGLAVRLAQGLDGEVISADSRQVYRGMDLGTGKDLNEYTLDGQRITHHLIDIVPAGSKYNIFEYRRDFDRTLCDISNRGKTPILCGGSGLYIEAATQNLNLVEVPVNPTLRESLANKSLTELETILTAYRALHNHTDTDTIKRAIRAIEIEEYKRSHSVPLQNVTLPRTLFIGIRYPRQIEMERIRQRLNQRLQLGMIEEVEKLRKNGISDEDLLYYGLEYKYITLFLQGKLTYWQMDEQLNIAIRQFAKRQMTWFRKMEKQGTTIHWLDYQLNDVAKAEAMYQMAQRFLAD